MKALYRRAQAYMETSDLVSAELDIKKALEADPQNRQGTREGLIRLRCELIQECLIVISLLFLLQGGEVNPEDIETTSS